MDQYDWNDIIPERIHFVNRETQCVILKAIIRRGNRAVAIKCIHEGMENFLNMQYQQIKEKFERDEVAMLHRVDIHRTENIVEVLGTIDGTIPDSFGIGNTNFLPLTPGIESYGVLFPWYEVNLHEYLIRDWHEETNDKLKRLLHIAVDVSKALCALHTLGVVHGDLKSFNVLLDRRIPPIVRLCDFGISSSIEDIELVTASSYMTGAAIQGTLNYLAPGKDRLE